MFKGALSVLGAAVLLAIGSTQAFALDPIPTVPVPPVTVPSVPVQVPPVPVPTLPVPPVNPPVVPNPGPSVPNTPTAPSSPVSTPSAPSLPGSGSSGGSSGSSGSSSSGSSGTGSSSGQSSSQGGSSQGSSGGSSSSVGSSGQQSAGNGNNSGPGSAQAKAKRQGSGKVRSFESRPPKFRSQGKGRRGTTLVVWLSKASLVGFSIVQVAPNCRGVGGFMRTGSQGKNLFRFSGRVDGRSLGAGTYRIRATTVQGQRTTSIKRETVVVVAPGQSVRSASAQRSTCGRGEEAAESRAAITAFAVESGEPPSPGSTVEAGSPSGQSEASGGPAGGNGAVVAPENSVRPADFLLQPRAPNLGSASDAGGGWSPMAFTAVGAMFIALLVIGGRELAERYRD